MNIRSITFMPYGDLWKLQRRLLTQHLNPRVVDRFQPYQYKSMQTLLRSFLHDPHKFYKNLKRSVGTKLVFLTTPVCLLMGSIHYRYSASIILSATYAYEVAPENDTLIGLNEQAESFTIKPGTPGASAVDLFPIRTLDHYRFK